jgi:hypothetical protein
VGLQRYNFANPVSNGHIKRVTDQDIELPVFEIIGTNVQKNYIALPESDKSSLKIKMPILVILAKNVAYFLT